MTDLLGVMLCSTCRIPYEEFSDEGRDLWFIRLKPAAPSEQDVVLMDIPCQNCRTTHKRPMTQTPYCPECGQAEHDKMMRSNP